MLQHNLVAYTLHALSQHLPNETFAEATLLYVCPESHIGLGKVYPDAYTTTGELLVSTSPELGKLIQLQPFEVVLEVGILVPDGAFCDAGVE